MRKITRAATLALSTLTLTAFLAPAAQADDDDDDARLTVCVWEAHGRDTEVSLDRRGPGGAREGEADPCVTFRNLRSGLYLVDIDAPRGFRVEGNDDDRWVRLSEDETERINFSLDRRGEGWNDHDWDDWHHHHDDDDDDDHDHDFVDLRAD